MAAAARRGRHQGPGHPNHDAAALPDQPAARDRRRRGHRRARHRRAEEAPQRRTTQQSRQRPAGAPPANRGGAAGPAAAPKGRQQAPAGAEQLANRTNALLAKLPKEVADGLRRRHTDPNELLRRTTEELNRRNAAKTRGADADAAAPADEPPQPEEEQQNGGQPQAREGDGGQPQTPASAQLEKHINDGMRALKLSPDEQAALRNQFQGDPQGLFQHIKALYNAEHGSENDS